MNKHLTLLILSFSLLLNTLQAQQFTTTTYKGKEIERNDLPNIINELKQHNIFLSDADSTALLIENLILLSEFNRANLSYEAAFNYAGEALFLAEELQNDRLLFLANQESGLLNYLFKQDKASGINFEAALTHAKAAYKDGEIEHHELYPAYYNTLLFYQRIENLDGMRAYIDTCQNYIERYNWGLDKKLYMKEKNAFLYYRDHRKDEAFKLLREAEEMIMNNEDLKVHKSFLIVIQGVLGDHLRSMGRHSESTPYLKRALNVEDQFGEHTFYLEYLHTRYSNVLFSEGKYKEAYQHLSKGKEINDAYLNPRKDASQGFLSIKDRYKEELNMKTERLQKQAVEIAEQKAQLWKIRVFFFIIVFLFTVALLLILRKRQKQKQEDEIQSYLERRKHNEALIEHKNKELTSNMLQMIEKDEIISQLKEVLQKEVPGTKTKTLFKSIDQQSSKLWDDFNKRFMEQNTDFYKKLQEHSPNLSAADLKVCALIKLNFSGKEMAYLLGISEGSVHVARHRLRKKLNLGRDVNLVQFINGL